MSEKLLSIDNLSVSLPTGSDRAYAIEDISLALHAGETVCVVGESGSGKSLTAKAIMALLPAPHVRVSAGKITFGNEDLVSANYERMRQIRGSEISMIFQEPMTALNPVMTIGSQIDEIFRFHATMTANERREKAIHLLNDVNLPDPKQIVNAYAHELSGGQRQRAMIAMALALNPKILIADEPTTALDVTIQAQIFELMDKLKKENDTAIILITHDMGVVAELADNVAVMYMGNIVEAGTADDVLRRPTHPYTKALLESVPVLGRGKDQDINPIKGSTPDPYNRPVGCQFAPRCNWKTESCDVMPEIQQINETHQIRCHKYEQFFESYNEKRDT